MEVRLRVASGKNADQVVPVLGPRFFIGRAEECQLRPHTDTVSRHHCVLLFESNCILVRDLGSKNGTFVNDKRVQPEAELKNGDRLRVGQMEFEVHMDSDVSATIEPTSDSTLLADPQTITLPDSSMSKSSSEPDLDFEVGFGEGAGQSVFETAEIPGDQPVEVAPESDGEARRPPPDEPQEPAALKPDTKPVSVEQGTQGPGHWHQKSAQEKPAQEKSAQEKPAQERPAPANTRSAAGEALKQFLRGR